MKIALFHGDVILVQIGDLPVGVNKKAIDDRGIVLAEGELTGHYHAIQSVDCAEMYEKDGETYLSVKEDTEIFHQKHKPLFYSTVKEGETIKLPKRNYRIDFPLEYNHFEEEARKVVD